MRKVICPKEIVCQTMSTSDIKSRLILLEAGETIGFEILTGQSVELGSNPHMVLAIGFVQGRKSPGNPAYACFNGAKLNLRKSVQDA